jgi:hypothetical protein
MYAYTIDENSDISILMRCKRSDSKQCGMYQDFGTTLRENEPNILFSAARSFVAKSAGLFVPSEYKNLSQALEIKRIARESVNKSQIDIYTNPKVREILKEFNLNQLSVVMELFCNSHLVIMVPMPYFKVEPVNIVLSEELDGTKLQDLSFHWISLSMLSKPRFTQQFISSFNFQILSYCADIIASRLFNPQIS